MSDSDNDEDLKRAIALSLQQSSPGHPDSDALVIDLVSSDDEDDDLEAPITRGTKRAFPATLLAQAHTNKVFGPELKGRDAENSSEPIPKVPSLLSPANNVSVPVRNQLLSGLNRKEMEEERLARAKKPKSEQVHSEGANESRKRKLADSPPQPQQAARHVRRKSSTPPLVGVDKILPGILSFNDQQVLSSSGIRFPNGVVKKTWAYGFPRKDDIKIEEVFQKDDLELAILSSFQVEPSWVTSKLIPATKVIWVLQAKTEFERANFKSDAPSNYKFCFPNMEGNINCMHSKLQLLSHPTYLRICIPSANLVPYDWGETGVMENTCFLIDLPRLPEGKCVEADELTDFGKELLYFTQAMGLPSKVCNSLRKFDFSHTSHLAFIHSMSGGSHTGFDWKRTGYCGLGNAVRKLGLHTNRALDVDFVTASVGNLNESFLKSIYLAAQGDEGLIEYQWRTQKRGTQVSAAEGRLWDDLKNHFQIYFPTEETVAQSKGGVGAGGTICFQPKWYDSESFPRSLMRDCKSTRQGMLMHNKIMFVKPHTNTSWAYLGSANLSESAWGRLVKDKTTKQPKLNCRNWECGVIFTVPYAGLTALQTGGAESQTDREMFHRTIPIPMITPGEEYGRKRPWFYNAK